MLGKGPPWKLVGMSFSLLGSSRDTEVIRTGVPPIITSEYTN